MTKSFAGIFMKIGMIFALVCTGVLAAEARTNYALIVGVTKYPNLPKNTWLIGPDNDAALVSEFLVNQAGFDRNNVTVLADGVDGGTTPTLQNIRGAMKALAEKIRADGDSEPFVYLHFSGHGSQMPARVAAGENDGKDEVFLPADTRKWDNEIKGFPNAYVDDDIGADITMLRDTGAFVWAIFDACHSSSATRAAPGPGIEVSRRLDPSDLGVPADLLSAGTRSVGGGEPPQRENPVEGSSAGKGGLVAFFAAQTVETTPEMPLPRDAEDKVRYGLFTYTLFQSLAEHPGISYRQLGQTILETYAGMNRRGPTPLFEGEDGVLDNRVFGVDGEPPVIQWKIKAKGGKATIEAGRMHRLAKGTKLALLASAADTLDEAKGYMEVRSAKNLKSTVVPIAHNGKPAPAEDDLKEGGWVRPIEFSVDFTMTVARPAGDEGSVNETLERLAADSDQPFQIRLVDPGEPADITLTVASEAEILETMETGGATTGADPAVIDNIRATAGGDPLVWFLPPSGNASLLPGHRPPSLNLRTVDESEKALETALASRLTKIFRATNIARMSAASDFRGKVDLAFMIRRSDADDFETIEAGKTPYVSEDDEIHVRIANKSSRAVDLNVLHVGTDYAVTAADPVRIEKNGTDEIGLFAVTADTLGVERLIAVVTEALPGTDVQDLRFLSQGGMRSAETQKGTSADEEGLVGMLNAMGKRAATRGTASLSAKKGGKGAVMIYTVETVE